jgi:hypothetical protein
MVPVYNLNQAKLGVFNVGVVDRSDTTNDTLYTGFEASFNVRLPGGAMLFGSWTAEHTLQRWCDNNDDPNGPTTTGQFNPTAATTGVDAPLGGRYCDQTQFDYPFIQEVKFAGNYSLPYSIDVGAVLQSYGGVERVITWTPEQARFPNNQRTQAQTFILTAPGSVFYDRWNQLDLNVKKNIRLNSKVADVPDRHLQRAERQCYPSGQQRRRREPRQRDHDHDGAVPEAGGELQVLTTKTGNHEDTKDTKEGST